MKENIEERASHLALYIIENKTTVRGAASKFGISKSTVHTAVTNRNGFDRGQQWGAAGLSAAPHFSPMNRYSINPYFTLIRSSFSSIGCPMSHRKITVAEACTRSKGNPRRYALRNIGQVG